MAHRSLSEAVRKEICIKARAGEAHRSLAREYGTSARTVGRIALLDPETMEIPTKPVFRVKAIMVPMAGDISFEDWIKDNRLPLDPEPKGLRTAAALAPAHAPRMGIQSAYRVGRQSKTGDGSIIVFNSNERPAQVLRCPVYNPTHNGSCMMRETVTITSVKGKTAKGEIRKLSGEVVEGELFVFGVGETVTRVEFWPDKIPASYARKHAVLRTSLA